MSTEVSCVNGDIESQQLMTVANEKNDSPMATITSGKSAATTDSTTEASAGTGNQPSGTPSSGGRSQKSKKRQNQKTFSLLDIFDMHQGIGSWADAAAADSSAPSFSLSTQKKAVETDQVTNATQQAVASQSNCIQYPSTNDNRRPHPSVHDRASHSKNVDVANLPNRAPFEVKVANINYKSSNDDLVSFFGGEHSVINIRSEGHADRRGTAILSFSSQEALLSALNLNGVELHGRSLRISVYCQSRPAYSSNNLGQVNNSYWSYRNNNSNQHEGGYRTLPHPRRGPNQSSYHSYNADVRINRLPPQRFPSYRGRDNLRYDVDNRSLRHPRLGNNQFYPRHVNRSFDSFGMPPRPPPHNDNHFGHHGPDLGHEDDRRGSERLRTESLRSNATDNTEKHERRKLQLQPRTKPFDSTDQDLPARPTSIFGLAKPVDTYEKERQAEERLRLENEAFKAAEQRSRKGSNEHVISVPPTVLHQEHAAAIKPPLSEDRENCPPVVQKPVSELKSESAADAEQSVPIAFPPQSVFNEGYHVVQEKSLASENTTPSATLPSGSDLIAVRRSSLSNHPEVSDDKHRTATLPRARNSYNRTFTRSRESARSQFATSKQQNIPARRGKSGSRRVGIGNGGGTGSQVHSKDKHFTSGKEKFESNSMEPMVANKQKQHENGSKSENQPTSKGQKNDTSTPVITTSPAVKQRSQQQSEQQAERQQHSKKEKKKQATAATAAVTKEMPKYIESKPFTFSSENKYAALLEADD